MLEHILSLLAPCPPKDAASVLLACKALHRAAAASPHFLPTLALTGDKLRGAQWEGRQAQLLAALERWGAGARKCQLHIDKYWEGGWALLAAVLRAVGRGGGVHELELHLPAGCEEGCLPQVSTPHAGLRRWRQGMCRVSPR